MTGNCWEVGSVLYFTVVSLQCYDVFVPICVDGRCMLGIDMWPWLPVPGPQGQVQGFSASRTCCGLPVQVCNLGLRLPMEGMQAPVIGVVVESNWELIVVGLRDQDVPEHSAGLHVGFTTGWEETAVAPWGGHNGSQDFSVVPSIWQDGRGGSLSVCETRKKLIPILFVGYFFNPALERSECINCDLRDIHKQELEILHDKILVAEKAECIDCNLWDIHKHELKILHDKSLLLWRKGVPTCVNAFPMEGWMTKDPPIICHVLQPLNHLRRSPSTQSSSTNYHYNYWGRSSFSWVVERDSRLHSQRELSLSQGKL